MLELASEEQILDALSRKLRLPAIDLTRLKTVDSDVLATIDRNLAEREMVLPIAIEQRGASRRLQLAMADPTNLIAFDNLQFRLGLPGRPAHHDHHARPRGHPSVLSARKMTLRGGRIAISRWA